MLKLWTRDRFMEVHSRKSDPPSCLHSLFRCPGPTNYQSEDSSTGERVVRARFDAVWNFRRCDNSPCKLPATGWQWPTLETHGDTAPRQFRGTRIYLYGRQMKTSEGIPIETEFSGDNISAMVLWAPVEGSDAPWLYFVEAIEAVSLGRFYQAIVPAHAAGEISIAPIGRSFLTKSSENRSKGLCGRSSVSPPS
jgi:hypothetical protein